MNTQVFSECFSQIRRFCLCFVMAVFVGCASTPLSLPTEDAVEAARATGTLETMFNDLKLRASIDPSAAKLLKELGTMIAEDKVAVMMQALDSTAIEGLFPVSELNKFSRQIESVSQYSAAIATELKAFVAEQNASTQSYVRSAEAAISNGDVNISEQLEYADVYNRLNGKDPAALRGQLLNNAYNLANNLEVAGDYEAAYEKWKTLAAAAPDYQDTIARLNGSSSTFNLDRFNTFMEAGDVDGATALYTQLAGDGVDMSPLRDSAQQLVTYFALEAESALDDENLAQAFESAKLISAIELANSGYSDNPIATAVLEALILRSELYVSQDRPGLALGSAIAATELAPQDSITADLKTSLVDFLYDKSITRLSLGTFSGTGEFPQVGNRISSLIKEKLVSSELNTLKLIERDKLQSVFVEKELLALQGGEVSTTVEPADIVVQGEVLSARVDEGREERRKKKRVVVEIERLPNPAYAEWLELSNSKREKTPEPEEFLEKEIKEDISITSIVIRKDGFLSVAYRLINPVTANIMSYQSLEEVNQFSGEAVEGIEIGLFVQEAQVPQIPGDGQVAAELTEAVAGRIAGQLIERFSDPVGAFTSDANVYLEKDQIVNAAFELGKAYSFGLKTAVSNGDIELQLRDMALSSSAYLEE